VKGINGNTVGGVWVYTNKFDLNIYYNTTTNKYHV